MTIISNKITIDGAEAVHKIMSAILSSEEQIDRDKEHFWAIGLNCRNVIEYIELVSLGTLTCSLIHPRETYRLAIMKGVNSIILVHNHPSGLPDPSTEDKQITKRLSMAGSILGVELLDHIIIGRDSYFSFKAQNLMEG